ncbi:MAG TPA: hypothetical protein VGL38_12795 [bacterium]|jgi:hypothetical protein
MTDKPRNKEIEALEKLAEAFESLDPAAALRVVKYVLDMKSISLETFASPPQQSAHKSPPLPEETHVDKNKQTIQKPRANSDIRSFAQEKSPKSENERALVVMFYLSEVLTGESKVDEFNASVLEPYFKQAKLPVPKHLRQVLVNTKNAGYIDQASAGHYKLNAVGYNLVEHKLPANTEPKSK